MPICRICKEREATKKNSHQLPSFLAVMVSSDGAYKRGKEMMFTFDKYHTNVYAHELSSTEWENTFGNLTEERIKQISINPVSEDYVFCPQCEKMLADYLESPYSNFFINNRKTDFEIPIIFWISVVWRLSVQGTYGFTLEDDLNERLRETLNLYFLCKKQNLNLSDLIKNLDISYRQVRCRDFCRTEAGYIHCRYDNTNKFFAIIVGDVCVCMNFHEESIPETFSLYGIEDYIKIAPINKGLEQEKWTDVPHDDYKKTISRFVKHTAKIRLGGLFEIADRFWNACGFYGIMPIRKKLIFAERIVNADTKIGDKYLPQIYIDAFKEIVENPIF